MASLEQGLSSSPKEGISSAYVKPFERVRLQGHFVQTAPFLLGSKPYEGSIGQYVISPFETQTGEWVLVLRGWTNQEMLPPSEDATVLVGQVREPSSKQWFYPESTAKSWYRIDPEEMGKALNHRLLPFYILEDHPPLPLQALPQRPQIPNNHLAYIVTWFSLAFALCVMVIFYLRKDTCRDG